MKKTPAAIGLLLAVAVALTAQESLSFQLEAGYQLPLGTGTSYFAPGPSARISLQYQLPALPWLGFGAGLGYDNVPIRSSAEDVIHTVAALGCVQFSLSPARWLRLQANLRGGYYYPLLSDPAVESHGNLLLEGGTSFYWQPTSYLNTGIAVSYRKYLDYHDDLGIALCLALRPRRARALEIQDVELLPIFPVLFKRYKGRPIGKAVLENRGSYPIEDIRVTMYVDRYMDNPTRCPAPEGLKPGERATIDLHALFSEKILEITEDTIVSASIVLEYSLKNKNQNRAVSSPLRIYNRNAMSWDDDRKAAAYVTSRDPTILHYAKNVTGWTRAVTPTTLNRNLLTAFGLGEALRISGLTYIVDPRTPFAVFSKDSAAIDFLQFPSQTLSFKAGDCDDLSILYCALLEAVGIRTAFITIPGHIYMAFSLGIPEKEAKQVFTRPEELLFLENDTWVPLEITLVQDGFLGAWRAGAMEYRSAGEAARFYPLSEAWKEYESVGFLAQEAAPDLPAHASFARVFEQELKKYIDREIAARVVELGKKISQGGRERARYQNALGVLYARYGMIEEAKRQFELILAREESLPAQVNLANLLFMQGNAEGALKPLRRAQAAAPDRPEVLFLLSRVHFELRDFVQANRLYAELKRLRPEMAAKVAFLDSDGGGVRAAQVGVQEEIVWVE